MAALIAVGDVARDLTRMLRRASQVRHNRPGIIAGLNFQPFKVYGSTVYPGRRACFQPTDRKRQFPQSIREPVGRCITCSPAIPVFESPVTGLFIAVCRASTQVILQVSLFVIAFAKATSQK